VKIGGLNDPIQMRSIDAVRSFLSRFQALDPDQASIRWPNIWVEDNRLVIDRGENHTTIREFLGALYEHGFVRDFDWVAWQWRAVRFVDDPKLLEKARLITCIKLLTLHARKERFVDGHFASMTQAGHITAILNRISEMSQTKRKL